MHETRTAGDQDLVKRVPLEPDVSPTEPGRRVQANARRAQAVPASLPCVGSKARVLLDVSRCRM